MLLSTVQFDKINRSIRLDLIEHICFHCTSQVTGLKGKAQEEISLEVLNLSVSIDIRIRLQWLEVVQYITTGPSHDVAGGHHTLCQILTIIHGRQQMASKYCQMFAHAESLTDVPYHVLQLHYDRMLRYMSTFGSVTNESILCSCSLAAYCRANWLVFGLSLIARYYRLLDTSAAWNTYLVGT